MYKDNALRIFENCTTGCLTCTDRSKCDDCRRTYNSINYHLNILTEFCVTACPTGTYL